VTIALVIAISLFSLAAFKYPVLSARFDLTPFRFVENREYYRIFTHAFLHADLGHLVINMIVLLSFGMSVEKILMQLQEYDYITNIYLPYAILILVGISGSAVSTIIKHRAEPGYSAVGASGVVSAIVFMHIFFKPMQKIYFYFAIPIPGIVFGVLYLIYSSFMRKRRMDNINHDAHIWGAIIGFFFPLAIDPHLLSVFISNFKF